MENDLTIQLRVLASGVEKIQAASGAVSQLGKAANTVSSGGLDKFGKTLQSAGSRLNVFGQRMTWMVTVPLLAFGNKAIDTALDVEKSFLRLKKVFGGTEEDMKKLQDSAWDLSTKFGRPVEEVTQILMEFNKAGITSAEDLAKLGEITSKTAIVFDVEMDTAIQGVKSVMMGYNLTIGETETAMAQLNAIADKTTASEQGILEVFNRAAGTARQAGFSFVELASSQAVFEKNAIPAGRAGNAMKSILVSLNKQSNIAKDQFDALGVSMTSTEWKTSSAREKLEVLAKKLVELKQKGDKVQLKKFQDSLGNVTDKLGDTELATMSASDKMSMLKASLIEAEKSGNKVKLDELRGVLDKLNVQGDTSSEKIANLDQVIQNLEASGRTVELASLNEAMASLVGKFQVNNLNVLLEDMAANFDNNESTASQFYDALAIGNDELGSLEFMTGQINKVLDNEATKMAIAEQKYREQVAVIGKELLPIKLKLLEALTGLLEKFNALPEEQQKTIIKFGMLAAVIGPIAAFAGMATTGLGGVLSVLSTLSGIGIAGIATGILAMSAALLAVVAAWAIVKPAYDELQLTLENNRKQFDDNKVKIDEWQTKINEMNPGPLQEKMKIANQAFIDSNNEMQRLNERYEGIPGIWNAVVDQLSPIWIAFRDGFGNAVKGIVQFYNDYLVPLGITIKIWVLSLSTFWREHFDILKELWSATWQIISNNFKGIWNGISTFIKVSIDLLTGNWSKAMEDLKTGWRKGWEAFEGIFGGIFRGIKATISAAVAWIIKKVKSAIDWVNKAIAGYNNLPGAPNIKEIRYANGGIVYAAQGMLAKGRDTIPAMLSPGEMVLNRNQQNRLFDMLTGKTQMQAAGGGPVVNINVGTMVASRGEQREFARHIKDLLTEDSNRY